MPRRLLAALALLALALPAVAQNDVQRDADRLVTAALQGARAYETLEYLTDNIGPRLSGSTGAALAVKWTTQRFRAWGIDVRNEKVMVPHWVRGVERGRLVSHNNQRLVLTALGGSVATSAEGLTAEVVEVRSYDDLKVLGAKLKGKIVFYNSAMDMGLVRDGRAFDAYAQAVVFRADGASRAAEYGAVAALVRSVGSASLRTPHTGALRYDTAQPRIPAAALAEEDALLIHRLLKKGERVRMQLTLTPKTLPDVESANVIAEIRGSERPDEIVLIGGHLDSWDLGTGAVDNGTGIAMVMETMRLIKELGLRPRRTIRCVLFMNEENGLRGAKQYFENNRKSLEKHVAAIESDAGGSKPTGFLTTLRGDRLIEFETRIEPVLERLGAARFESSKQTGADTSYLTDAGVPGFSLVPNPRHYFDWHHTAADTLDKIDPMELAQDTAAVAALTWVIAATDVDLRAR